MKVKENNLAYKTESGSIKEFLYNIKQKIVKSFDVEKIILFGSYAYGKPKENSDVDLFIVMKTDKTPAERRVMIGRLFSQRLVPMDFIVKTPQ
ncbi:MAG: nucleotidyltransferase domain-containing protein, partial [Elusimicrobiota bacterium]